MGDNDFYSEFLTILSEIAGYTLHNWSGLSDIVQFICIGERAGISLMPYIKEKYTSITGKPILDVHLKMVSGIKPIDYNCKLSNLVYTLEGIKEIGIFLQSFKNILDKK